MGLPQFYQQGFGNPLYNYPRPWFAGYWQDQWNVRPNFTFNYGLRYELEPALLAAALPVARSVPDGQNRRRPGASFAPRVTVTRGSTLDHIVALLGRRPSWPS